MFERQRHEWEVVELTTDEHGIKYEYTILCRKKGRGVIARTIIYRPDTMSIPYFTTAVHMLLRSMIKLVEDDDDEAEEEKRKAAISVSQSPFSGDDMAPTVYGKGS